MNSARVLILQKPNDFLRLRRANRIWTGPTGHVLRETMDEIPNKQKEPRLLISGVTTRVCVQTSMHDGSDRGEPCRRVADGCKHHFPTFRQGALGMHLAENRAVGWVAGSDTLPVGLEWAYGR